MTTEPVLATYTYVDHGRTMVGRVYGGLHYLKGNKQPHFSLTYWEHRKGRPDCDESGGAGHNHILRFHPRFADLAAMHLSDLDGAPMHAEANGWYHLAGALGGMGERYHVGNSKWHMPLPDDKKDPHKPWQDTEYREPTPEECVGLFADYIRVTEEEAREIISRVRFAEAARREDGGPGARDTWCQIVEEMRPRWKQDAENCIAAHGLVIYGDKWEG